MDYTRIGKYDLSWWLDRSVYLGKIKEIDFNQYKDYHGVYMAYLNDELIYIEKDITYRHSKIQSNLDYLEVFFINTGRSYEASIHATKLRDALIKKFNPPWNMKF